MQHTFELACELEWDNQLSQFSAWDDDTVYDCYTDFEPEWNCSNSLRLSASI